MNGIRQAMATVSEIKAIPTTIGTVPLISASPDNNVDYLNSDSRQDLSGTIVSLGGCADCTETETY